MKGEVRIWIIGTVIAICSLAVSIITAWTIIKHGAETETHYKKIVTPMVLADVSTSPVDDTWGIFLKNEGIGPAVINYGRVLLDGEITDMQNVVTKMSEEGALGTGKKAGFNNLRSGSYIGAGMRKAILSVSPESLDTQSSTKFRKFVRDRIDIHFEWCSVYEECKKGCTKEGCIVSQEQLQRN